MIDKWDSRFLELAFEIASWSKDPSTKVGCVLVDPNLKIVGTGFNGFPAGMNDGPELYADREVKYKRTIHAEINAILNARGDVSECTAYVSAAPCTNCALVLIQSGIDRVVYPVPSDDLMSRWGESIEYSRSLFTEAEVEVQEVSLAHA
jgi:dCMP deaminase